MDASCAPVSVSAPLWRPMWRDLTWREMPRPWTGGAELDVFILALLWSPSTLIVFTAVVLQCSLWHSCVRAPGARVCVCVCRVLVCNVGGTDPPDLTDSKQISKIFVTTWGHFSWGGWESASFHPKDSVWIYHDKRKGKDHNTMRYDKRNLTWPEWGLL